MARRARWLIEGTLTVETPLHLGTGGVVQRPLLFAERPDAREPGAERRLAEVSAVATDHRKRAYLPGTSIKGALRSWLREARPIGPNGEGVDLVEQIFGTEEAPALELRKGPIYGGKAAFWNSFIDPGSLGTLAVPFPSPGRATGVRACVSISRRTKTAADERLFFEEVVPAGVRFALRVALEDPSDEEVRLVLFALAAFSHQGPSSPGRRVSLGAGGADGDGLFTWTPGAIRRLRLDDPVEVERWLAQNPPPAGFGGLPELSKDESASWIRDALAVFSLPPRPEIEIGLRISFDGPFLIAAPMPDPTDEERAEARKGGGPFAPDRVPVTDSRGKPVLPASSLRGALRSRAEAILRTLGNADPKERPVCDPSSGSACASVQDLSGVRDLCPVCRLFGAPGWGTAVVIDPFIDASDTVARLRQEHVAIDRFTGGGADRLKFNAESWVGAAFEGSIRLDLERGYPNSAGQRVPAIGAPELGLLALVLRDLVEGDIGLGSGAAKGYGACRAMIERVKLGPGAVSESMIQSAPEALGRALASGFEISSGGEITPEVRAALQAAVAALHSRSVEPAAQPELPAPEGEAVSSLPVNEAPPRANQFHNPYHFVPLPEKPLPEAPLATEVAEGEAGPVTHDRFGQGRSGRIVFRVTTRGPVVIGAHQNREDPDGVAQIDPFELDGQPALPASSLRGLLSSLAEAASGSALRVLGDRRLSVRAAMGDSLGAIGILEQGNSGWVVRPLTLPHIQRSRGATEWRPIAPWPVLFAGQPVLRVYVNRYFPTTGDPPTLQATAFLGTKPPSSGASRPERWYMKLPVAPFWRGPVLEVAEEHSKNEMLLAQKPLDPTPICQIDYDKLSTADQAAYTPGLLRVLGIEGRENEMPRTKKHETFLPLPVGWDKRPVLEADEALSQFYSLADDRTDTDESLPFELAGTPREANGRIRLRAGDLVCFKPDDQGKKVAELAISSIWCRDRGRLFEYVPEELLPLNPHRRTLSLAEQLFGYVEQGPIPKGEDRPARALASRVRFSFGRLEGEPSKSCYDPQRTLQILATPKPPSPSFYFRERRGSTPPRRKGDLRADQHTIQGRKMYLHHRDPQPWVPEGKGDDKLNRQRSRVKPLRPDLSFVAHLDFDNLTERELGLLLYALRPTAAFRHKLGMGKPLGLGTVEIAPLGLFLVDRATRYGRESDLLAEPRYHAAVLAEDFSAETKTMYPAETLAVESFLADPHSFFTLRESFRAGMEPAIRTAIELLGDPAAVVAPVGYPRTEAQTANDTKGYEWFVLNEEYKKFVAQRLNPIAAEGLTASRLPLLSRQHEKLEGSEGAQGGAGRGGSSRSGGGARAEDRAGTSRGARPASAPQPQERFGASGRWVEARPKKPKR